MEIPPKYTLTPEVLRLISEIEAYKLFFSSFLLAPQLKEKIQRISLLKSSLFSARIEGNTLGFLDLDKGNTKTQEKMEIFNILDATKYIDSKKVNAITKKFLLEIHKHVLNKLSSDAGVFRQEPGAIFNSAGIAVYVSPLPNHIPKLLDSLLIYINSNSKEPPLIVASIAHLLFEKIHPFIDGNGRVGRLLINCILKIKKWNFMLIPFEEYLDDYKNEYYLHLEEGLERTNDYLIFMLKAFWSQLEKMKSQIEEELTRKDLPFLPPRQEEILNIIKEHNIISFDSIRRRFLQVPERTLRYDLSKLVEKSLVEKTGETRGRYYRAKLEGV